MDLTNFKEEWKYTNISSVLEKAYVTAPSEVSAEDIAPLRMPGHHKANELVFVNGRYTPALSQVFSPETELVILPLKEAMNGSFRELVSSHLNKSADYIKDGVHALNTSDMEEGMFIHVHKGVTPQHPIYVYHVLDGRQAPVMAQPRNLVYVAEGSRLQLTETYATLGTSDSFCNEVLEIVVAQDAYVEYYKLQNDVAHASQVNTTHISQIGRSYVHTVVISLGGGIVRNNMNLVLDAANNEAHMYGLYLLKGKTHVDNHTLIDNKQPGCFSNQLYKGIADDSSTGVFNGRIMVQPDAQKTNAYQSNKNILLSYNATINAKPQLEIFADDVKCSHGCTVGQLDEEALFYLRARGIPKEKAEVLLLQAYAADIIAQIKPMTIRAYAERLILEHLSIG
ncbi:Fe-S cluster assembly protein SufD [Pedobacter frigoris]|uniref:Fe-S cluster assembly protein SufD n=1 Tax=Pedobacter frigoris TaxID=2571272 RepID=UPI00292FA384|nr:Fe-S cluster assembly protein SufD [Pedobacter frigoris]